MTKIESGHPDFFCRDFTAALASYRDAATFEPDNAIAHLWEGVTYEALGDYTNALNQYTEWALRSTGNDTAVALEMEQLRACLWAGGQKAWVEADLKRRITDNPSDHFWLASDYAKLGHTNEALALLRLAYDDHDPRMTGLLFDQQWDAFRDDPRFRNLLTDVGLTIREGPRSARQSRLSLIVPPAQSLPFRN